MWGPAISNIRRSICVCIACVLLCNARGVCACCIVGDGGWWSGWWWSAVAVDLMCCMASRWAMGVENPGKPPAPNHGAVHWQILGGLQVLGSLPRLTLSPSPILASLQCPISQVPPGSRLSDSVVVSHAVVRPIGVGRSGRFTLGSVESG